MIISHASFRKEKVLHRECSEVCVISDYSLSSISDSTNYDNDMHVTTYQLMYCRNLGTLYLKKLHDFIEIS